jgi:asparagine synthase (glutamine-hydrolysing)
VSAIAGVYVRSGPPLDQEAVCRMISSMAYRRFDSVATWRSERVSLGNGHWRNTPESLHEQLPLVDQASGVVLVADARIDNRKELISALGISRSVIEDASIPDSQLIRLSYEKWGQSCVDHLVGDFAFALWDDARQELFAARDHLGVRPFYYYDSPSLFAFGSEIKALLYLPEVPSRLNETRVADYLLGDFQDYSSTFYRNILRLPPAHTAVVSQTIIRISSYWALDPTREIRLASDDEYAEAFRETFHEAVRCRLRTIVPVGSLLSGGLDSSSIVCAARQLLPKNQTLHTFSAVFPNTPSCDERPYIQAVCRGGSLSSHLVEGDSLLPLDDMVQVWGYEDEAFYAPNLFLHRALYRQAQKEGIRIILDGLDGDTTVSHGLAYLGDLAQSGRWFEALREARALSQRLNRPAWRLFRAYLLSPHVPTLLRRSWRTIRPVNGPMKIKRVLRQSFLARAGLDRRNVQEADDLPHEGIPPSRARHFQTLSRGLIPFCLEVANRSAAAFCLEPRYPFFDRRLVELCLALPGDQKLRGGWTRFVLRRAMEGILPEEIQWRSSKADLSPNFITRLFFSNPQRLQRALVGNTDVLSAYFDVSALLRVYQRAAARPTEEDALIVWKAATLATWMKHTGITHS